MCGWWRSISALAPKWSTAIPIIIHGIQVRADANGSEVLLPKYRDGSGEWRTAISLPDELKGPMGDAVLAAGIEAGILVARSPAVEDRP